MWNTSSKIVINNIIFYMSLFVIFNSLMIPVSMMGMPGTGRPSFDIIDYLTYIYGIQFIIRGMSFFKQELNLSIIICMGNLLPFFAYVLYPLLSFLRVKVFLNFILFVDILNLMTYVLIISGAVSIFHGEDSFGFPVDIVIIIISILTLFIRIYQYKKKLIFSDYIE